ncbi:MAG: hypothetical protein ORN50_07380 [Crocinitomicaceae bacterium]|nr:hypothetical protein [Crocinitomicaceae bacterium]
MSHYELTNIKSIILTPANDLMNYTFPDTDILNQIEDKRVRITNLSKALTFGTSSLKGKTSLVLDTNNGQVRTEAVVIGFDNTSVWLEGNIKLPMSALRSVDFI